MWLSILIFFPIFSGVLLLFLSSKKNTSLFFYITLFVTSIELLLSSILYFKFSPQKYLQFSEKIEWINLSLGDFGYISIEYYLALDGFSLVMVWLSALVMWVGAMVSWQIKKQVKGYFSLYLILSGTIVGCFVAWDFFLFYLFFEFMLLPMFFLIGIWGGERREYASMKFFIYTLLGSLLILISMIALNLSTIDLEKTSKKLDITTKELLKSIQKKEINKEDFVHSFNIKLMMNKDNILPDSVLYSKNKKITNWQKWAFWLLVIGFLIKLPSFPFHTWLPDAHVEAPTPVSVVLAGVLLKVGGYGIYRFGFGIFPEVALQSSTILAILGVISIIYGAMNALAMTDLKKMVAYSSVSHMGFVLLGFASHTQEGTQGAIFQMFSHGILSAMLFVLVGILYVRTHDRNIDNYKGLSEKMPFYTSFVMIGFFASLGLPVFSGFIGELFTLLGAFKSHQLGFVYVLLGVVGIILGAGYFLWTLQRMFFGEFWVRENKNINTENVKDLFISEWFILIVLSFLTLLTGLFPYLVFDKL
ncbi:MAG: NADH-quinone oxidoreductase subunit M [Bacteroidetes bacterium]|nr:MAG: NADH-quinone oxidoreductase subunit M [Bacteroidota bacterium]TAG89243.1 MAG: NADH-quinone oxidoreductase subunit M [Bacteroidota bacterium]